MIYGISSIKRVTETIEKITIKSALLEKRVEGVMKIEEKERNYTMMLEEASKMVGKLSAIGYIDGVKTHDNKLKMMSFIIFMNRHPQ